ncbi:MAG: HmuY family protein [Rikenellaceae bacterium]|nr:HmuY family protein [Rikenellaceae bacterium]
MKINSLFLMLPVMLLSLAGCDKNDDGTPPPQGTSMTIEVKAYDKWTYFSFENGIVPEPDDFTTSQAWDLAFHRWDVRTNGGQSGAGQGGTYMLTQTTFDNLPAPDASRLVTDGTILTYMQVPDMTGENNQRVEVPASTELGKWMTVKMATTPPGYEMAANVFMVRTAGGKWAAMRFTNYMNDKAEKGYASFTYLYPLN